MTSVRVGVGWPAASTGYPSTVFSAAIHHGRSWTPRRERKSRSALTDGIVSRSGRSPVWSPRELRPISTCRQSSWTLTVDQPAGTRKAVSRRAARLRRERISWPAHEEWASRDSSFCPHDDRLEQRARRNTFRFDLDVRRRRASAPYQQTLQDQPLFRFRMGERRVGGCVSRDSGRVLNATRVE